MNLILELVSETDLKSKQSRSTLCMKIILNPLEDFPPMLGVWWGDIFLFQLFKILLLKLFSFYSAECQMVETYEEESICE